MSKKAVQRTIAIGGASYTITVLGAKDGMRVGVELASMMLPSIGVMLDDQDAREGGFESEELFLALATSLVSSVDSNHIVSLFETLLGDVYKGSQPIDYDDEFQGELANYILLVEFALKENFADFFPTFFKAKGLEIPSLGKMKQMLGLPQDNSQEESKES